MLLSECVDSLVTDGDGCYIDCTVGTGGHTARLLDRTSPRGQVLGIDADPDAIRVAGQRLEPYAHRLHLVNDSFGRLEAICREHGLAPVDGILLDLGLSSAQLADPGRGFSFTQDGPLDMRFAPKQSRSAADIVNTSSEAELASILRRYGEERFSSAIARRIVAARPVETTGQLAQIIEQVRGRRGRIHPATRTFQALRIAVNGELDNLEMALPQAVNLLRPGGRLAVMSYHSLEDRLVKTFFSRESKDCLCPPGVPVCACGHRATVKLVVRKPITPSLPERRANPRSRSARLRVAERL